MPRNRRPQPKAEKRAELVAAARQLFLRDGYAATAVGRIARAAEVTPNTVYWYFRDKDELLIAVLDELFAEAFSRYLTVAGDPIADQLVWLVDELRQIRELVSTVHARLSASPALAEWHNAFHANVEALFQQATGAPPPETRHAEAKIVTFTVEGLLTHDIDNATTREVCHALAARWSTHNNPQRAIAPAPTNHDP